MKPARPQALTVVIPVLEARPGAIEGKLAEQCADVEVALKRLPELHEARIELLAGERGRHELLIQTTFDGELKPHVGGLARSVRELFRELSSECRDAEGASWEPIDEFLQNRARRVEFSYLAAAGRRVRRIRAEVKLERRTRALTSRTLEVQYGPALGEPSPRWSGSPEAVGAALAVPAFELQNQICRAQERRSLPVLVPSDLPGFRAGTTQTPFTGLLTIRPGVGRRAALRRVLRLTHSFASDVGLQGFGPGGLAALHAARMVLLPGPRLLVTGHCDGTLHTLFDRWMATTPASLTALFMHTTAFPPTLWLRLAGRRPYAELQRWLAAFRAPRGIWYSAYSDLSVDEIRRNARVSAALAAMHAASAPRVAGNMSPP